MTAHEYEEYTQGIVRVFKVTVHYIRETHATVFEPVSRTFNVEAHNDRDAIEAARLGMTDARLGIIDVVGDESIIFYEVVLICEVDVTSKEIVHE